MLFKLMTAKQEAGMLATSFTAIIFLGCASLIAFCFAALWVACQVVTLLLSSMIEALSGVGALYQSSDSLVKFLILCAVAYALYRACRPLYRRIVR